MIAGFQDAFVALAADSGLRRRFLAAPLQALADFDLDDRERAALMELPREDLERYARSLVAKRWLEVARFVPLTLRVSPGLEGRYKRWAGATPAPVIDSVLSPGLAEALRAVPAMVTALTHEREAPYAADLFAFEALRAAARADGEMRTMTSRFPIQSIADEVQRGLLPIDPERLPTELRFSRGGVAWRNL